jgi:hypothetical protein
MTVSGAGGQTQCQTIVTVAPPPPHLHAQGKSDFAPVWRRLDHALMDNDRRDVNEYR